MYERNAIVIDRYFAGLFGYDEKNNLKNNYSNYEELVTKLKKYQDVSDEEDRIMLDVEKIANSIKETQKIQEAYYRKNLKLQDTKKNLFDDLDEDASDLKRKFERLEEELNKNSLDMKENENKFIEEISEFNAKSITRTQCGKERRIVENDYRKSLNSTTDNYNEVNKNKISDATSFLKQESDEKEKQEIKSQILKNGLKEKVPFYEDVIVKAIDVSTDIEEKRLEILVSAYDKTGRLLNELRNENIKIERHQKFIKDSKNKLTLLNAISEYLILFLDNERMNVLGGVKEHKKLMDEACENFDKDIVQIKNLYNLLLKEISGKASKKAYKEMYKPEYLADLLKDESKFEKSISKLNVIGTVIYPSYWRVEGMQKIFDAFRSIITDEYEKDLSEYEPIEEPVFEEDEEKDIDIDNSNDLDLDDFDWGDDDDDDDEADEEDVDENDEEDAEDDDDEFELKDNYEDDNFDDDWEENDEIDDESEEDDEEDEIEEYEEDDEDRTVDEILGFYGDNKHIKEDNDEIDEEDNEEDDEEDDEDDEDDDDIDFDWDEEDEDQDEVEDVKEEKDDKEEKKKKRRGFFNKKKK